MRGTIFALACYFLGILMGRYFWPFNKDSKP